MTKPLTFQQAKRIAARVGARIEERKGPSEDAAYRITISGRAIKFPGDESVHQMQHFAASPEEAAHKAVLLTAQYNIRLYNLCKEVYISEDCLWQRGFTI